MLHYNSIANYHHALNTGATTCEKTVQFYLKRIREQNHLNAFLNVYEQESISRAQELDTQRQLGKLLQPLHGVVVSIKDVIAYKHHPLQAASNMLDSYHSSFNATAVERLIDAGAIIIGSNNCDEFAMGSSNENSAFGPVLNARDATRVSGGSSGGSAVAVQAQMCMASLGSDTGGSVRQPADFCGIVGLKPTYGRISRFGLIAYGSSFDQIGVFSSNVEDVARILTIISGSDAYDATVSSEEVPSLQELLNPLPRKPRVGYLKQMLEHPSLDPEIREKNRAFIGQLEQDGYTVKVLDFELLDYIVPAYYILTTAEASSNLSRYDGIRYGYQQSTTSSLETYYSGNRTAGFGKEVQKRILLGTFVLSAGYYDAYFTKAQQIRRKLLDLTKQLFEQVDLLISPVSPETAFRIGEKTKDPLQMYLADIYTVFANLTGIPAISIPLFEHSNGLPFSLQIMSAHFEEAALLSTASSWMTAYKETAQSS